MTKIVGIFGDPVSHSLSPAMHNAAFAAAGLDWVYVSARVRQADLASAVRGIRAMGWVGVNLTIPHKERAIRLLDRVSREARSIGAVNTIVCTRQGLVGHNTDGRGFVSALEEELSFHPRRKRVVLLGAGGAARGIGVALGAAGVRELTVLNRTPRRASGLARHLRKIFKRVRVSWSALGPESAARALEQADLLVNASAVGMGGTSHRDLPLAVLPKHAIVSDIVYRPLRTPLLASASKLGLRTQGGLGMLLHQGAEAFTLWTGQPAPVAAMRRALRQALLRNTPP